MWGDVVLQRSVKRLLHTVTHSLVLIDSHFPGCSRSICFRTSGAERKKDCWKIHLHVASKANVWCRRTQQFTLNGLRGGSDFSSASTRTPPVSATTFPTKKKETTVFRMMPHDEIWSRLSAHSYSRGVLERTSPLAVVSSGAYLSAGWYDALWTRACTCDQSYSANPWWKSDWGCQSSLQTGLSSPRQEAASRGGAASSHLPAHLMVSTRHAGQLFWFQPVWHICCLSRCVVAVWELSSIRTALLFYKQGSRLQPGLYGT